MLVKCFSVKVFELYPPQLLFNITISLHQREYEKKDGTEVWVNKATFHIGPGRRSVVAPNFQVSNKPYLNHPVMLCTLYIV